MKRISPAILVVLALSCEPLLGDTILYFRFEEGSGYTITDDAGLVSAYIDASSTDAGAGDTGAGGWSTNVPNAVIPLTGSSNCGAIHYPGAEIRINRESPGIPMGTSFTIEFYFKLDYAYGGSFFALRPIYYHCSQDPGGRTLGGQFFDTMPYHLATNILDNHWYHLALVKTPGQYSVFLDGVHQFTDALPPVTDGPYTSVDQYRYPRTIGGTFYGWIDEFRICDEALTPDQFLCTPWKPVLNDISLAAGNITVVLSNVVSGTTTTLERTESMSPPITWYTAATFNVDGTVTNWSESVQGHEKQYYRVRRNE